MESKSVETKQTHTSQSSYGQIRTEVLIVLALVFALGVLIGWAWPDVVAWWRGMEAVL